MAVPIYGGNGNPRPGSAVNYNAPNGYNVPYPIPVASTIDQTQRAGERSGAGQLVNPTTTGTYTDSAGDIHSYTVDNATGIKYQDTITGHVVATPTGQLGGGVGGPTWYEQQQIALDKQRIADAEAAQAAQLAYQHQQQLIAQSNAVEAANQAFRDAQLKSTYGTINGMAYGSPKGSPFVQALPEPLLIKQAYAENGQTDPWAHAAPFGGYTGSGFMNAQQPGLSNQGDSNQAMPTSGPGSAIPLPTSSSIATGGAVPSMAGGGDVPVASPAPSGNVPGTTGQPQLIMAHGGEKITPAPGTPMPTLMGSPGGAPFSNPTDPNDPNNPGPSGGSLNDAINNLIQAAQALVTRPDFKAPIAPGGSASSDGGGAPIPGMASGGMVSGYPVLDPESTSVDNRMPSYASTPSYARGGIVPSYAMGTTNVPVSSGRLPLNAYGQMTNPNMVHAPQYNDINAGPGRLNHLPYSPALSGLSGYGATMTPNGTPVVMSNYQRQHLMPSSISGPGGYDDYAMQVAGWSPADLQSLGTNITGNFGTDLVAPKNYAPIGITPAPAGG